MLSRSLIVLVAVFGLCAAANAQVVNTLCFYPDDGSFTLTITNVPSCNEGQIKVKVDQGYGAGLVDISGSFSDLTPPVLHGSGPVTLPPSVCGTNVTICVQCWVGSTLVWEDCQDVTINCNC